MNRFFATSAFIVFALPVAAQSPAGLWDAVVTVPLDNTPTQVPFRVEFAGAGKSLKAWFFNGDERIVSTSSETSADKITARFAQYNSRLEIRLAKDSFDGTYTRDGKTYPVHATRFHQRAAPAPPVPSIDGAWLVQTGNRTGEKAWRLVVHQTGAEVTGAILRVDGDSGVLTGRFAQGAFTMSHFSGARPAVYVLTPAADGSLNILQNGTLKRTAIRAAEAQVKGLPQPDDPMHHTTLRDPGTALQFSFPDLNGKIVSNTDELFKGKVVILSIGGSWCPNCHDEAPLLGDLYRKYRAQGLEIVELSFEEAEQLANPTRLREFIRRYGIQYTVLLAGAPAQLAEKLPQAVNLDTFPATFFIGRDGLVISIHSGFTGKAMGHLHDELVEEITATVKRLLAGRP
jgi:thiol-disulfide isomerase/thioredoxin